LVLPTIIGPPGGPKKGAKRCLLEKKGEGGGLYRKNRGDQKADGLTRHKEMRRHHEEMDEEHAKGTRMGPCQKKRTVHRCRKVGTEQQTRCYRVQHERNKKGKERVERKCANTEKRDTPARGAFLFNEIHLGDKLKGMPSLLDKETN